MRDQNRHRARSNGGEYTALIFGAVNLASRLESAAEPGKILISRETWSLVKDAVIAEEMPPLSLKGFGRTLQVYELLGLRESVSTKTIRRKIDGMNITIELARGNREQAIQVLKELIDEIDVERIAT
jgi:adenylate cyclase